MPARCPHSRFTSGILALFLIVALLCAPAPAVFSAPEAAPTPAASPATSPSPESLAPYTVAEIASEAEAAESRRRKIEADLASWAEGDTIQRELPDLSVDIAMHLDESMQAILSSPSFESLPELEKYWRDVTDTLGDWKKQLTQRIHALQGVQTAITQAIQRWEATGGQAETLPPDVAARVKAVLKDYRATAKNVEAESASLLKLQARVAELETKVADVLAAIRQEMVKGLFTRDKKSLWTADTTLRPPSQRLAALWNALVAYTAQRSDFFLGMGLAFGAFALLLRHWRALAASSSHLIPLKKLFQSPIAAALLLTLTLTAAVAPSPPRLFWVLWTGATLLTAIHLLLPLVRPSIRPLLAAVVALFIVNEVRDFAFSPPFFWRLILLAETGGGVLFTLWALRRSAFSREEEQGVSWKVTHLVLQVSLLVFCVATVANLFWYARPAAFLVNALTVFINHAVIAYTFVRLADGYLLTALSYGPLSKVAAIAHHRDLVWRRLCLLLRWGALVAVLSVALQRLGLRSIVQETLMDVLGTSIPFTSWSILDVLHFGLSIWAAFLLSRFIRFLLDEEVYPRLQLSRGLPYAISTVLHYAILLGGFLAAVGNLSRFTILAGAFGVGLGFGLQNIVNNFVSGLILLFERPVKVGDVVQIDADTGVVQRIGIRASVIRTPNGSELILPNSKLISDKVTNWTFSSRQRGFDIPLSIPRIADPAAVVQLLEETARQNPRVANVPAPQALLVKLTATTLDFELRAWTNQYEDWVEIRSELVLAIEKAFTEHSILPLPA